MIKDSIDAIKRLFVGRSFAYNQVFSRQNQFTNAVLKDLAKFCRAYESTFDVDQRKHAALEGRREVWLRIAENLELSGEEIYELHKVKEIAKGKP